LLDLIDALTVAGQVSSPVALSEQKPFRRKFGSIYAVDGTANEREAAETLPDRRVLKSSKDEPVRYGHKYSWLV